MVPLGQESGNSFAWSSVQGPTRQWWRCPPGCVLLWGPDQGRSCFSATSSHWKNLFPQCCVTEGPAWAQTGNLPMALCHVDLSSMCTLTSHACQQGDPLAHCDVNSSHGGGTLLWSVLRSKLQVMSALRGRG